MLTKNGICYDLESTPYTIRVDNMVLHFSSALYQDKFWCEYNAHIEEINYSLSSRFNFYVNARGLAIIILYRKIEKRGFCVTIGGVIHKCQKELVFNGTISNNASLSQTLEDSTLNLLEKESETPH